MKLILVNIAINLSLAEIFCPLLGTPQNGVKSSGDLFADAVVQFDCDVGYEIFGNSTVECQIDGKWSGTIP